jgi:autotransporter-associated beta strand protein
MASQLRKLNRFSYREVGIIDPKLSISHRASFKPICHAPFIFQIMTVSNPPTSRPLLGKSPRSFWRIDRSALVITGLLAALGLASPAAQAQLPVTSGLVLRMDASQITGSADGAQLNTWADTSGLANNAARQGGSSAGFPKYVTGALNGQPVVRFNSETGNTGDYFQFNRISAIRTVFWVLKDTSAGSKFLLGDDSSYQFHRGYGGNAGKLWDSQYASDSIRNGTTKLMGAVINGTTTSLPSGSFQLVSLVTTGNVQANQICQDRVYNCSWQGDIAEILIYDRALSALEEESVGAYLSTKYALITAYPAAGPPATPTGVAATPVSTGAISVSWPAVSGATTYNVSYKTTVGGTEQVVTGVSPYTVSGLTNGTSYDFKVSATNFSGTSAYSGIVMATPVLSSGKDILTFVFPGQLDTVISGTNISLTVPTGTNVTALAPTFTVSPSATASPASGTALNFTSAQTYTITAEDTTTQVYTVTVTTGAMPNIFTWTSAVAGNWSESDKWTNNLGTVTKPINAGQTDYRLNFTQAGTYTTTQNLSTGFLLNQLNFGGAVTLAGTNSLALSSNGATLPTLNQNSASAVTISAPLSLVANTTLGGSSNGQVSLNGSITGAGSLTKNGGGTLALSGANNFTGGTNVTAGTLTLGSQTGFGTGSVTLAAGTTFQQSTFEGNGPAGAVPNAFVLSGIGNVTMNMPFGWKDVWLSQIVSGTGGFTVQGGSRKLTLTANNTFSGGLTLTNANNTLQISHLNALGTGTLRSESAINSATLIPLTDLSSGTGVSNAIDIASGAYLNVSTSGDGGTRSLLLSGSITSAVGTGNLNKIGAGTLTLTGANSYNGLTKVAAGTLAVASAGSLGGGALDISTGAVVALNFTGTRRVSALTLATVAQAAGTYGATGSGATNTSANFTGTGILTVGGAPFAVTTTTLALTSGSTPAAVGASLTFTATVAGSAPSGNVNFYDGVTLISTQPLSGTTASFTTTSLALGTHPITARYVGDTANDPSVSAAMPIEVINPTDIQTFTFPGLPATTITGTNITVTVPFSTNVTALTPTYTLSPGATCVPASGSTQNFTNPVNYVVSASGFPDKTYIVTVTKAEALSLKDITSFVFAGLPATTIGSNTVSVTVPFGTAVSNLSPTYTVSSLASGSPVSGTARNFSSSQTYTITAEDNSTKSYSVIVTVAPANSAKDILTCDFGVLGPATIAGTNIKLTVAPNQNVTALAPTFTISPLATISPASGTARNFTTPQAYTVTAQNGTTQVYTVAVESYETWTNSASFFILTTPEGANIASGAAETNFPLLLRLHSGNFNFAQAQSDGRDIRFTTQAGAPLSYQIEQWDAANSAAAVWIKIPSISANARQEVKMYWGKTEVASESNGLNVFNSANGYVSVMHLNETVADSVGTLTPTNIGTTVTNSLIGKGRTFVDGNGVNCGDNLTSLPSGNVPHSTGVWFRSNTSGFDIFDWGREDLGKKVQIRLISPPQINIDGNFAGVNSNTILSTSQWHYIVNTYSSGTSRIYIDGQLDASDSAGVDITPPSIMRLGGWYGNYHFVGEMDEARLSKVARSANWIKMEFENQKPQQTLVGNLVQSGSTLAVNPTSATLLEGTSTTLNAQAGGAQKVYWIEKRNGVDTVLGTDTFTLPVSVGRVTGTQSYIIQFKAMYAGVAQTRDIPITVTEDLPDPVFTLTGPNTWDGRQTITVTPNISNLATLQAKGLANMTYNWTVGGVAATKTITTGTPTVPGVMTLTRAQGSGPMTVTLVLNNGGALVTATKTIIVTEPATDPYVTRVPGANEIPVTGQFYARDPNSNLGTLYYNGTQSGSPNSVFLKVYTTDTGSDVLYATHTQPLAAGKYAFTAPLAPGRVTYKVVYGTTTGGVDTIVNTVNDLVCGDAYIFEGQSNAWATDSLPVDVTANPWIRTYGHSTATWGRAARNGSDYTVGYFAYDLALSLTTQHNMPICIINGAVGGTRVDQHQANPANHTVAGSDYSIYATLLNRVAGAKLTHGIRGIIWHQGENNSGSASPTGDYDYVSYQRFFVEMSAAWKQDYPNFERYIVFQVMPRPCSMGPKGDQLREAQRTLPLLYSKMDILNTLAVPGYIGCHFTAVGYENVADRTLPVVNHRFYGIVPPAPVTAPILQRAYFTSSARTAIALVFDQAMSWSSFSTVNYYVDDVGGKVTSGSASGNVVTLQLSSAAATTATLDYLQDNNWNFGESTSSLLYGANSIPALTFADVPIEASGLTSQTITFGALPAKAYLDAPFALTATASSGLTVSYMSSDPLVASVSGNTVTILKAGSTTITASQAGNASFSAATPVPQLLTVNPASFTSWASNPAQGLTTGVNDGPLDDPDRDGIYNLMEFTLGGAPMTSSQAILPKLANSGGNWVFEYDRSDFSLAPATTQVVEYGSNLTGWTPVTIPATTAGIVTITPGSPSDHVKVTLPASGNQVFARLKVSQP